MPNLTIPTPRNFDFRRTIISHGWCELLPFEIDREKWRLIRVIDLQKQPPITISLSAGKQCVEVQTPRAVGTTASAQIVREVTHMLRLDDDMSAFYRTTDAHEEFKWIARQGAGRMLRSPTVFEDLVKMICTTNCSWALTEKMVTGLVQNLGRESKDGRKTFPTPEALALMPVSFFVDKVRAGYRAPYLKELADKVAAKSLDVEAWFRSELTTAELTKTMRSVKGVGPYTAENLLKLLGRYDGLALDSWTRAKFFEVRNKGRKASD
ncbi:MAG TPA: hypothetical protein VIV66_00465, partial [Pyrinomonadaceae bacterium]